jgi:hypothetical protein
VHPQIPALPRPPRTRLHNAFFGKCTFSLISMFKCHGVSEGSLVLMDVTPLMIGPARAFCVTKHAQCSPAGPFRPSAWTRTHAEGMQPYDCCLTALCV